MGKGKKWGFLKKFEIYRNVELLGINHQFKNVIITSFMGLLT